VGGAGAAAPVSVSVLRDEAESTLPTPGKATGHLIHAGDVVSMRSAGGGGFGDPLERDPARVLADVQAGYVSLARARDGYGVVLTAAGEADLDATRAQRAALAGRRRRYHVQADERDPYEGKRGKHRVLRLASHLAQQMGLESGDLVELRGRHPAPLRAWIREEPTAPNGDVVPLDSIGRRILGVQPGDTVEIYSLPMPPIPGGLVTG
jgi:N-methylhydantoinase B